MRSFRFLGLATWMTMLLMAACGGDAEVSGGGADASAGAGGTVDGGTGGASGTGGLGGASGEGGAAGGQAGAAGVGGATGGSGGVPGDGGQAGYGAGGPCVYEDVPGTATIVSIADAPSGEYNCTTNPKKVSFSFAATDTTKAKPSDAQQSYRVGGGANPPDSCLAPNGIAQGAQFAAKRRDIQQGSCSPTMYELTLPQPDLCINECYQ